MSVARNEVRFLRHGRSASPYRDRFQPKRVLIEESPGLQESEAQIDQRLRARGRACVAWRGKSRRFLEVFSDRLQRRRESAGGNRGGYFNR